MGRLLLLISWLAWVGLITSCQKSTDKDQAAPASVDASQQVFQVTGVVVALDPSRNQVEIKHEAIPGYMPAMTMPFEVKQSAELTRLHPGLAVTFRLNVMPADVWIDQIRPRNTPATNGPPAGGDVRVVRDVQPLELGDPLPEYHLIDEFGRPITTAQFKGQVLAITFLFTRCPLPNFCPLMANHFAEVQKKLLAMPNATAKWHLLTISFDPEFDKPEVLKGYAQAYHYDPDRWTFATGTLMDITAIADQLGLTFWHDQMGSISHNLRTAVIDPKGRLAKVYQGNDWTSDELTAEMLKAAGK